MQTEIVHYDGVDIKIEDDIILSDVSFTLHTGEFVFLLGRVGSGKSSLLKSLYGDVKISRGSSNILGYNLANIKRRELPFLRRRLGIVFQDYQLLVDRDIEENLKFVLESTGWRDKKEMHIHIEEVLKQVGMETKIYKYPHQLSGGEQQRVVIARALLNAPDIILADEPTGNLDTEMGLEIMNLLYEIHKAGIAVLVSTHNKSWVERYPARHLLFADGKISEGGLSNLS